MVVEVSILLFNAKRIMEMMAIAKFHGQLRWITTASMIRLKPRIAELSKKIIEIQPFCDRTLCHLFIVDAGMERVTQASGSLHKSSLHLHYSNV